MDENNKKTTLFETKLHQIFCDQITNSEANSVKIMIYIQNNLDAEHSWPNTIFWWNLYRHINYSIMQCQNQNQIFIETWTTKNSET